MIIELKDNWIVSSKSIKRLKGSAPCTVLSLLLDNKIIENPYYRCNEKIAREYLFEDYTFETTFSLDEKQLTNNNFLCLERICTIAEIFVNEVKIADLLNFHVAKKIPLDKSILKKDNTLKILFKSSYQYIKDYPNPKNVFETFAKGVTEEKSPTIRQPNSMFGWDWGPSLADIGITKPIYILSNKVGYIDYYRREFRFVGNKVCVDITPHAVTNCAQHIEIELSGFGYKESKQTQNHETVTFEIDNPKLWNPVGFGEQPLYDLTIKLYGIYDTVESKHHLGIREVKIIDSLDDVGRNFAVYINGNKVFLKGASYVPEDSLLTLLSPERSHKLLDIAKSFNHNCVRIWGGGYYPDDDFLDYCDQIGLLVMQDLMFACASYDIKDESFRKTVIEEVAQNVRRMSTYASIFMIAGNNEIEDGVRGHGYLPTLRVKEMFNELFEDIVSKETSLYYLPSSPTSGDPYYSSPNDPNYLDTHYWWVWGSERPFEDYLTIKPRFLSEFGCQSFTTWSTIGKFSLKEDRELNSEVMRQHTKMTTRNNNRIIEYTSCLFKTTDDLKQMSYLSMLTQAEGMKLCVEHLRQNKDVCNGALYWQLNDCWPGQSWSSIDYYFGIKALLYYAKKFYAPDLVSFNYEKENVVTISNDTNEDKKYQLKVHEFDINGKALSTQTFETFVNKYEHKDLAFKKSDKTFGLLAELYNDNHQLLSENYLLDKKDKDIDYPKAKINIKKVGEKEFEISSDTFVRCLYLMPKKDGVILSENFFNLMPKMNKKITANILLDINDFEIVCLNNLY